MRQRFYASGSPCFRRRCRLSQPGVTNGLMQISHCSLPILPLLLILFQQATRWALRSADSWWSLRPDDSRTNEMSFRTSYIHVRLGSLFRSRVPQSSSISLRRLSCLRMWKAKFNRLNRAACARVDDYNHSSDFFVFESVSPEYVEHESRLPVLECV